MTMYPHIRVVVCPKCQRRRRHVVTRAGGYRIWRCSQGHVRRAKMLTLELATEMLLESYVPLMLAQVEQDNVLFKRFTQPTPIGGRAFTMPIHR